MNIPVVLKVITYLGAPPTVAPADALLVGDLCRKIRLNGEISRVANLLRDFSHNPLQTLIASAAR